jgi:hypothetical protein
MPSAMAFCPAADRSESFAFKAARAPLSMPSMVALSGYSTSNSSVYEASSRAAAASGAAAAASAPR